jgi:hypothetical protein
MRVLGSHQTTYSDWARAIITHYPHELTYHLHDDGDRVDLYHGDEVIGHFDFGDGTGEMKDGQPVVDSFAIGKWPSFQDVDVDKLIHVV